MDSCLNKVRNHYDFIRLAGRLGMSDRIYVICPERSPAGEADKVDQNTILQYAFGQQKRRRLIDYEKGKAF